MHHLCLMATPILLIQRLESEEKIMTKIIDDFRGEYGFLSNFHQHPFEYKGLTYPNSEAAFQAQKCATEEAKIKYTQIKNPVIAKRTGKKCKRY